MRALFVPLTLVTLVSSLSPSQRDAFPPDHACRPETHEEYLYGPHCVANDLDAAKLGLGVVTAPETAAAAKSAGRSGNGDEAPRPLEETGPWGIVVVVVLLGLGLSGPIGRAVFRSARKG